jgi:hypothetical protein
MPSERDSFRRNRVAPLVQPYYNTGVKTAFHVADLVRADLPPYIRWTHIETRMHPLTSGFVLI